MAESNTRPQLIAGIFVLCGMVLIAGLILEFGPLQHWMRRPYTIHAVFADTQNLIKGAPVRFAGTPIGLVSTAPELAGNMKGVKVSLDIYPEYKIPRNSSLKIATVGLMGDCAVDVQPPPDEQITGEYISAGETMDGKGAPDLTAVATKITDEATEVMKDIRSNLAELNKTIGRLNTGVLTDENFKNLASSISSLNRSIEKVESTLLTDENVSYVHDSLADLRVSMASVKDASGKANSALAKIDKAMDQIGPGMKGFAGATSALRDASVALENLLKEARSGKGVLYALLNDTNLRDNLQNLILNMRQRGLLFYKDKPKEGQAAPPAPAPSRRVPETPRSRR